MRVNPYYDTEKNMTFMDNVMTETKDEGKVCKTITRITKEINLAKSSHYLFTVGRESAITLMKADG
jgi:hypothetical protein